MDAIWPIAVRIHIDALVRCNNDGLFIENYAALPEAWMTSLERQCNTTQMDTMWQEQFADF
ncbi:MAG: hypothetical protein JXX29_11165 [Deltaproteobacteria bacterium]|nr:hypothetical protein [Deltaproteobacteria bacterium]MBN2672230.1 hypothetical protein [Deltaproteobacteria bacterium]